MNDTKNLSQEPIVIDPENGLVFDSETQLLEHFEKQIEDVENYYFEAAVSFPDEIQPAEFEKYENNLNECLSNPDEVWSTSEITSLPTAIYIKEIEDNLYHVAICYQYQDQPSFIFMHFPSRELKLVQQFCKGDMLFDRSTKDIYPGAIEGDALTEGDELAVGHYKAMMMIRSESDIPQEDFKTYAPLREESIEFADEIWRTTDSYGQSIVTFIKRFSEPTEVYYIVVTLEDPDSDSNILLFSFPTNEDSLADRYRQGENLQADEIVQENSH